MSSDVTAQLEVHKNGFYSEKKPIQTVKMHNGAYSKLKLICIFVFNLIHIIDDGIKKSISTEQGKHYYNNSDFKTLPLLTTHNPNNINIIRVLRQLKNIL